MDRFAFLGLVGAAGLVAGVPAGAAAQSSTIYDIALNGRDFSTLVAAFRYAGLDSLLTGKGPYTLFAPTDAAFAKLPPGTVDGYLSRPDYRGRLRDVLTYHIVPGTLLASALRTGSLKTLNGAYLSVVAGKKITINDANLTFPDTIASNGVVQVIDTVLMPPTT